MDRKDSHISLSRMYESMAGQRGFGGPAAEHLETCGECAANRDWMLRLLKFGAAESLNEPPAWSVGNAVAAFRLKKPSAVRFAKELFATLIYDSFNEPLPAGMRQRDLPARQTLYRAEGVELDLKVQITGKEKGIIIGQVVSEHNDFLVDGLGIELSQNGELIGASSTNSWGEFMFDDLPRGDYDLQVQFGEKVLRLPKFPLGNS